MNGYPPECYVLALSATCTEEEFELLENGGGLVRNYILIDGNSTGNASSGSGAGGGTTQQEGPNNATGTGTGTGTTQQESPNNVTGTGTGTGPNPSPFTGGGAKFGMEWTVLGGLAGVAVVMAAL